jgi:acyl carrier protein
VEAIEEELKRFIIETLSLEDVKPEDIDPAAPLFVEGLGLDSIDALELGVGLQKRYGIKLSQDAAETKRHFASVQALAALVARHRAAEAEQRGNP